MHIVSIPSLLAAAAAVAATVYAALQITTPVSSASYSRGKNLVVQWIARPGDSMPPGDVSIDLVSGMASALAFVATIGTAPASSGSFKIAVPSDIPPASDYAIRLRDDDGGVAYSPFFAVKAGDGSSAAAAVSVSASAKESKSVSHVKNTATESASKATATHSSTDKTKASDNDEGSDKDKDKDKKTKTPSDTSTGTSAALAGSGTPSMAAIVTAATVVAITQLTLV